MFLNNYSHIQYFLLMNYSIYRTDQLKSYHLIACKEIFASVATVLVFFVFSIVTKCSVVSHHIHVPTAMVKFSLLAGQPKKNSKNLFM